jgi:hypothetical protein
LLFNCITFPSFFWIWGREMPSTSSNKVLHMQFWSTRKIVKLKLGIEMQASYPSSPVSYWEIHDWFVVGFFLALTGWCQEWNIGSANISE